MVCGARFPNSDLGYLGPGPCPGIGSGGILATAALPLTLAALLWLAMLGLGLLLLLRAEPVLSGEVPRPQEQPETPPAPPQKPTRPPPLLKMMPIRGGLFRMGSPPATEDEIREYAAEWAEAFYQKSEEAVDSVKQWLQEEEPSHRVRVSPFLMARTPVTRGQWRALMQEIPEVWEVEASDQALPATHVDWVQALALCNALSRREGLTPYQEAARRPMALGAGRRRLPAPDGGGMGIRLPVGDRHPLVLG